MKIKTMLAISVCATTLLSANNLMAHGGATGIVKERMDQMVDLKKAVKQLKAIYKGQVAYDAKAVQAAAKVINDNAGVALTSLYPEGSLGSKSEARPEIWQQWDSFSELATRLETASQQLHDNAGSGLKAERKLFKQVVKNCGSCHDDFRLEN